MTENLTARSDSLVRWLTWLRLTDCPCPYEWRGVGRLHGVDMGKGWIRMETHPDCPHHRRRTA